ncbi:hypothetical protein EAI_09583 [Harpegnathos saltator]|uniref:Uncharacterized protein n=1 Tax=Harpegnathos saltator TaxID=610380 RepID=E2BRR9_HARSA|nr:hypothetical protein EAI_09583 [Harpegnathos saltator]
MSSPNRNVTPVRLLQPLQNLVLRNRELDYLLPDANNNIWHHVPLFTPPSESLVILPNAPYKTRTHIFKMRLRLEPRRLFYSTNQRDTDNNETVNGEKKKYSPSQRKPDPTKESVLRDESPELSDKENQKCSNEGKSRNLSASNSNLRNTLTAMSTAYASRYEAVFLCSHLKGPKMSYAVAAKYMGKSKSFVAKWVQQYKKIKNVDDLPESGSIGKIDLGLNKCLLTAHWTGKNSEVG